MNTSINYAGFIDMYTNSDDDFEPYGYSDVNESLEKIYREIETYKSGFNDREYYPDE